MSFLFTQIIVRWNIDRVDENEIFGPFSDEAQRIEFKNSLGPLMATNPEAQDDGTVIKFIDREFEKPENALTFLLGEIREAKKCGYTPRPLPSPSWPRKLLNRIRFARASAGLIGCVSDLNGVSISLFTYLWAFIRYLVPSRLKFPRYAYICLSSNSTYPKTERFGPFFSKYLFNRWQRNLLREISKQGERFPIEIRTRPLFSPNEGEDFLKRGLAEIKTSIVEYNALYGAMKETFPSLKDE